MSDQLCYSSKMTATYERIIIAHSNELNLIVFIVTPSNTDRLQQVFIPSTCPTVDSLERTQLVTVPT